MASVLLCLVIVVHKWQNWTCFQRATKGTLVDRLASGYKECFWLLNEVAQIKGRSLFQWKTALKYHTSKKTMLDCHKSNPWNPHCIKAFRKVLAFICAVDYSSVMHTCPHWCLLWELSSNGYETSSQCMWAHIADDWSGRRVKLILVFQ